MKKVLKAALTLLVFSSVLTFVFLKAGGQLIQAETETEKLERLTREISQYESEIRKRCKKSLNHKRLSWGHKRPQRPLYLSKPKTTKRNINNFSHKPGLSSKPFKLFLQEKEMRRRLEKCPKD